MSEPKIVDFKLRWMRELSDEDRHILDDFSHSGSLAEVPPRINARLLPVGGSNKVSARTLSEAISLTQSIVQYAGYDVYHGINPDFADLRSLSEALVHLTRLSIEPFEEGSFVIPARLEANPLATEDAQPARQVTAEDVVKRFDDILESLQNPASAVQVSIGAIQTVEALGRVIRREAEAIEFSSFDTLGQPRRSLRVDQVYIDRVHQVRDSLANPGRARNARRNIDGSGPGTSHLATQSRRPEDSHPGQLPHAVPTLSCQLSGQARPHPGPGGTPRSGHSLDSGSVCRVVGGRSLSLPACALLRQQCGWQPDFLQEQDEPTKTGSLLWREPVAATSFPTRVNRG